MDQRVVISSEQVQVKTAPAWETEVLASQTMQVPWQAGVCSWEATGPHANCSVRKAGLQENSWEVMVIGGCIPPQINTLAGLLSSCIYFQDQETMKTLEIPVSKIRAVQVFKRHRGTGSLLEPKRWGKYCKCVFLSTAMENKWCSVAKYQWIRDLRLTPVKSFSCGMLFLWMLNPSGWMNYMFFGRNFLDNSDLASQAFILWKSYSRAGHCKFPLHSLII